MTRAHQAFDLAWQLLGVLLGDPVTAVVLAVVVLAVAGSSALGFWWLWRWAGQRDAADAAYRNAAALTAPVPGVARFAVSDPWEVRS